MVVTEFTEWWYVYGYVVTVETDHKPLLGIKHKPIIDLPPRLQRMRLRCQPYDYNLMYKPGKDLVLADTLSRACLDLVDTLSRACLVLVDTLSRAHLVLADTLSRAYLVLADTLSRACLVLADTLSRAYMVLVDTLSRAYLSNVTDQTDKLDTEQIHGVSMYTLTSDMSRARLRTATYSDRGLTLLKQTMMSGWPRDKKSCPEAVKPYKIVRNYLTKYEGIVFKGRSAIRKAAISDIHDRHFGIVKCTERAKTAVYVPARVHQSNP